MTPEVIAILLAQREQARADKTTPQRMRYTINWRQRGVSRNDWQQDHQWFHLALVVLFLCYFNILPDILLIVDYIPLICTNKER